jgi:hypothetical protein
MRTLVRNGISAALVSVALALSACSDDDDEPQPQPTPTPTPTPAARAVWVAPDSATFTTAQRDTFLGGGMYFNAHTQANPGGEIRGQLDKGGTVKLATLDGAQETPAVTTNAFGAGVLVVDSTGRVSGFVTTSGLTGANAAHVHIGARGVAGGIIVPLAGGPDLWVVPDGAPALDATQLAAFEANNLYFNVHTPANPNGEIRGQIDNAGPTRLATLTGAQETPAVTTTANGGGILAVDPTTGTPGGFVVTRGLANVTQAHVHLAPRGTAGGIIVPLTGGPDLWVVPDAEPALDAAERLAFEADGLYYNVHTQANQAGEIRGQLDKSAAPRAAQLVGALEVPAVTTSAFGAVLFGVDDGASGEVGGFAITSGLVNPTAAHVHTAPRGQNAGVTLGFEGGP